MAKDFRRRDIIDYKEVFSPVEKYSTVRYFLAFFPAIEKELDMIQLDVKTAFLRGNLDEESYMRQPEGFVEEGKEDFMYRFFKSLY